MRTAQRNEPVSVLHRVMDIIESVREAGGSATISVIASRTGIPKSSASRLVTELIRQRYLVRTEKGIGIGLRLFELGARANTPRRLGAIALPVLADLFNATGEHLNLAVQSGSDMLSVMAVRGRLHPAPSRPGGRVPAATTALGKAVLAFCDNEDLITLVTSDLTLPEQRAFTHELSDVRRSSVAIDRGVAFPGVMGIASPVLSSEGRAIAAISVAGPVSDMDPTRMVPLVRRAAATLTHRLSAQVA